MDKAEYRIATDHIKKLISQGEYAEASRIADTIDWRRVKSVMMLCTVSDLYKVNRRYEDARELLYLAYERNPESRTILYSLCDLCIKLEEFVAAIEYYKSFVQVAPRDSGRYVLQYRLYQAQDVSLEERIEVLEQLKAEEYTEKWAYELAYLYHRIGFSTKCVEECDELILWFGKGRYVYKAMELKMLHESLTPSQQRLYDNRFEHIERAKDMTRVLPRIDSGETDMTDESMVDVTDAPTVEIPQEYIEQELIPNVEDIQVKTLDVANTYNTVNLQKELAESLREILEQVPEANAPVEVSIEDAEGQYAFVDLSPAEVFLTTEEPDAEAGAEAETEAPEEKQITGQLKIEDILNEWSRQEEESQESHEAQISQRIMTETQSIFDEIEAERERDLFAYETEEEVEAEVEPEIEVAYEPEVETEYEVEPEYEVEYTPEAEFEVEYEAEPEVAYETEAEAEPEAVYEPEMAPETNIEAESEVESRLEEEEEKAVSSRVDLYEDFVRVKETESQIKDALAVASMTADRGNVLVTGHDLRICFDFIKAFVSNLKQQDFPLRGKTAKISAVNLNKKDPREVMSKVKNGLLIIERAGRLRKETVDMLVECLQNATDDILVFLTDTDLGMSRFVERYPELVAFFEARVDIKDYSSEDLVKYGVKYAYENEYSIDEVGVLELQSCIEVLISNDEAPEKVDVEFIVNTAIDRVNKRSFKHFMDVLLKKRYDDEDMIILRAEDFMDINRGYTE